MKITTVGIDLAKNVFQVHGIDERGKAVLRKQLGRGRAPKSTASRLRRHGRDHGHTAGSGATGLSTRRSACRYDCHDIALVLDQ